MALNSVNLVGRLTADPELKKTNNNSPVTNFSIAVDRDFKDANGEYGVDFINVAAFSGIAEFICKWFAKGDMICFNVRLTQNKWKDNDCNNRIAYNVTAISVYFCGGEYSDHTKKGRKK